MRNLVIACVCLTGGLLFLNVGSSPDSVAASTPTASRFDYGDDPVSEPVPDTKPAGPVGASPIPVIESTADLAKADQSAFSDVPDPTPAEVKPVGNVKPAADPANNFPPSSFPVASSNAADDSWTMNVFPIRCVNGAGCAVAVSPDTLLTAFHVARYANAQVGVNGQWLPAIVTHPPRAGEGFRDGALVKVANGQFPVMKVRSPVYFEPITVYGTQSHTKQRGFVSSAGTVSLVPEAQGIIGGDSGGAVVGDDGCLLGVISGHENGSATGTPDNPRVVMMTRADVFMPFIPKSGMSGSNPTSTGLPEPVGSVFPPATNQPSAFDPPVQPPREQASCSGPSNVPQQFIYQQTTPQNCAATGTCNVPLRRGRRNR